MTTIVYRRTVADRGYDSAVSRATTGATVETTETGRAAAIPRALIALVVAFIIGASAASLLRSVAPSDDASSASPVADGGVAVLFGAVTATQGPARVGNLAPDRSWVTPQGDILRLAALRGRPVVLNFWATWCVPCRTELPEFDAIAAENPDVRMLAIDLQEDAATVKAYVERLNLRALVPVLDPDGAAARGYGVMGLPTTFFIDADGVIRHVEVGGTLTREHLRSDLRTLTTR